MPAYTASRVAKQCFKSVVHVLLNVTVEEREAGLIGGEIDDCPAIVRDYYRVFDDSGSFRPIDLDQFPKVTVQVHRMGIICAIAHDQPITRALLQNEFAVVRIGLAIDQPYVEPACSARELLEDEFDRLLRSR